MPSIKSQLMNDIKTKTLIEFDKPTTFVIVGSSVHNTNAKLLVENANKSSVYITDDYTNFIIHGNRMMPNSNHPTQSYVDAASEGFISLFSIEEFKVWYKDKSEDEDVVDFEDCDIFIVKNCTGVDVAITSVREVDGEHFGQYKTNKNPENLFYCNDFELNDSEEECILHQNTPQRQARRQQIGRSYDLNEVSLFLRDGHFIEYISYQDDFDQILSLTPSFEIKKHRFQLRGNFALDLVLPADLTNEEAKRIYLFILSKNVRPEILDESNNANSKNICVPISLSGSSTKHNTMSEILDKSNVREHLRPSDGHSRQTACDDDIPSNDN